MTRQTHKSIDPDPIQVSLVYGETTPPSQEHFSPKNKKVLSTVIHQPDFTKRKPSLPLVKARYLQLKTQQSPTTTSAQKQHKFLLEKRLSLNATSHNNHTDMQIIEDAREAIQQFIERMAEHSIDFKKIQTLLILKQSVIKYLRTLKHQRYKIGTMNAPSVSQIADYFEIIDQYENGKGMSSKYQAVLALKCKSIARKFNCLIMQLQSLNE